MKITNRRNLPQPLVDVVTADLETPRNIDADWSVTQLLQPPQIARLQKAHDHELETDVSEHIYALMGKMVHQLLENAERSAIKERRLRASISVDGRVHVISGQMDRLSLLDGGVLQDWKTMSVWEHIFGLREDRENQLNMYAWLCEMNDISVTKLQAVGLFRDWRVSELLRRPDEYPKDQVHVYDIEKWGTAVPFIASRIRLHLDDTTKCSNEDTWYSGNTWAVTKPGAKRALKLFKEGPDVDIDTVLAWIDKQRDASLLTVEKRPGAHRRCEDRGDGRSYCPVSAMCPQWQAVKKEEQ